VAVAERRARVENPLGIHARPAAEFVKLASRFKAEISVAKDTMIVNGKSIMGVMTLAAECGSVLTIRAQGVDADEAARALAELVSRKFKGEEHL
jgi:phosphocarrier protein